LSIKQDFFLGKKQKKIEFIWIIFLISITCFFSFSIYPDFNGASFVYDSTYYLSVVDSLREGYGFSVNMIHAPTIEKVPGYFAQDY